MVALKRAKFLMVIAIILRIHRPCCLRAYTTSIVCSYSLRLGVLGVGDNIPDDVLQEHLEHSTGLLVDKSRETFDSSPPCHQTPDGKTLCEGVQVYYNN